MIYLKLLNDAELFEFDGPAEALAHIERSGWNPAMVQAWRTDDPMAPVDFEDLNRLAGRPHVVLDAVRADVDELLAALDAWFQAERGWRIEAETVEVSTGYIPCSSSVVKRWFGNPMARLTLVAHMDDHLTGDPPRLTAERIRIAIRGVEKAGGPAGWHVLTADVGKVALQTGLRGRAIRRHEVVLSKPRIAFARDLPSVGTTSSTSPPELT